MTGSLPDPSSPESPPYEPLSPGLFQHRRFWLNVAAYRPLLVLGALWLVLLAIAAGAYSRLIYAEDQAPQVAPPAQTSPPALADRTPADRTPADRAPVAPPRAESPQALSEETPVPSGQAVPAWSLAALVGTCALGCWVISRQAQAAPRYPQAARRAATPPPVTPSSPPRSPQRLAPYRPDQPLTAPLTGANPAPAVAAPSPPEAPTVAIVPEDTAHALDWPEGSLAHSLDVRQRRSLSSLL